MTDRKPGVPPLRETDGAAAPGNEPLYSEFIQRRIKLWWGQDHPGMHSRGECKNTLLTHSDSDEVWHCCPYWQRKLSNKLNARQFAIKCGVQVPKLYWYGKDPMSIPFDKLPPDYVVKTSTGWSSNAVLPLKGGHSIFNGKRWTPDMVIKKFVNKMSHKPFRSGYVFVEELMQAEDGGMSREGKCQVFDGRAGLISIIDRNKMSAVRFTRDGQAICERLDTVYAVGDPEELPKQFNEMVACAEALGRAYGPTFVRVDLHVAESGVVFGEFTGTPSKGLGFTAYADRMLGSMCGRIAATSDQSDVQPLP